MRLAAKRAVAFTLSYHPGRRTEKDRVDWYVVECECHGEDLSAVLPSYNFLRAKDLR